MTQTRRLVVLRHATAVSAVGLPDSERPLADSGHREAVLAGGRLRAAGIVPDLVICSPTRRTRRTWELVAGELAVRTEVVVERRIYDNDLDGLLDLVHETDAAVRTLLLVGHNPGAYRLVLTLTGTSERADGFPPATVAVIDLDAPWADVGPGDGRLVCCWAPGHG